MQAFEEQARAMQYDFISLSVYRNNSRARSVYERAGWKVSQENQRGCVLPQAASGAGAEKS